MKPKKIHKRLRARQEAYDRLIANHRHKKRPEGAFTRPGSLNPRKR